MRRRRILKRLAIVLGVLFVALYVIYGGGERPARGEVQGAALPAEVVSGRRAARTEAAGPERASTEILFGDFHVHTTFSADAFMNALPLMGGEGVHPPADACDYARYCSQLDFFALTDHAEMLTPRMWDESRQAVRDCNAQTDETESADLFAFAGFEWTQVGMTPETHYGHKNVIYRHTDDEHLPSRAIAAGGLLQRAFNPPGGILNLLSVPITEFSERQVYLDIGAFFQENLTTDACAHGVASPDLPNDCKEFADTPADLFRKLDEWGHEALVIPHGTTWGFYTPPGYSWDKQLDPDNDSPRQNLVEVFSGHGNSEEFRDVRHIVLEEDGTYSCPEPTDSFEPCCHRAGVLIAARCEAAGEDAEECERRAAAARLNYANGGAAGHNTVPGASVADWGNCGQCEDCFEPTFNHRPRGSVQYALARGHFEEGQPPRHATWGFIASSDNHSARPGTGYKDHDRHALTESAGFLEEEQRTRFFGPRAEPAADSVQLTQEMIDAIPPFALVDLERQASFFLTGGLVAVHAAERTRDGIWDALTARHVYGTSGDRILLWFDMVTGDTLHPMGADVPAGINPRFRVRAAGAFEQQEGCPPDRVAALGEERMQRLCMGECYHPGDARMRIVRIEVVRIRPQVQNDEPIAPLIEDPWRTIECSGDGPCEVEFDDPDFTSFERDTLYYVRAIQETTTAINAGGLRCDGETCDPCYGDPRTPLDDNCLSEQNERAWSSPIYVRYDQSLVPPEPDPDASGATEDASAEMTP